MILKAVAIDDEPLALEIIKQHCAQMQQVVVLQQIFDNAVAGLKYINEQQPDLVFVDIDMPDINGIELIRNMETRPMIVFTTAYKEFALEGFELEAVDYLLKPFGFERFEKAVNKAVARHKAAKWGPEDEHIVVNADYRLIKIFLKDIIYIESLDDYIKIHLTDSKPVMTLLSLKKISEKMAGADFVRIHRSYMAAVKHITEFAGRKIKLSNGLELPVGESYLPGIQKLIRFR